MIAYEKFDSGGLKKKHVQLLEKAFLSLNMYIVSIPDRKGLKSVATLLPLLGVTWLFGLFVEFHEVLVYIFILLTSTQVRRTFH